MTQRKIQYWVIPPKASGEFVAAMENVLETYAQPYDVRFPMLTMDEQPEAAKPSERPSRHRIAQPSRRSGSNAVNIMEPTVQNTLPVLLSKAQ